MQYYHVNSDILIVSRTSPGVAAIIDHCIRSAMVQLELYMFEARSSALEA
jgi:hypothetical protein